MKVKTIIKLAVEACPPQAGDTHSISHPQFTYRQLSKMEELDRISDDFAIRLLEELADAKARGELDKILGDYKLMGEILNKINEKDS